MFVFPTGQIANAPAPMLGRLRELQTVHQALEQRIRFERQWQRGRTHRTQFRRVRGRKQAIGTASKGLNRMSLLKNGSTIFGSHCGKWERIRRNISKRLTSHTADSYSIPSSWLKRM